MINFQTFRRCILVVAVAVWGSLLIAAEDLTTWQTSSTAWKPTTVAAANATLQNGGGWVYLVSPTKHSDADVSATVLIDSAATQFAFFGSSWSAWPDPTFGDQGFEAGLLLRADDKTSRGYRVQLSHKYQQVALVRFPDGGYVRSVPCPIKLNKPIKLRVRVAGGILRISVDDKELIHYVDRQEPALAAGHVALGVSSNAKVTVSEPTITPVAAEPTPAIQPHVPRFNARSWLGGRTWVFDGDEPILELHDAKDPSCFAKLKPGYKPQLTFDSHWGLENQGAFPDAASKWTAPELSGSGESLKATWSARSVKDRFVTNSVMTVGFDPQRGTYTYGVESELEVLPSEPFHFRYGFDFEHHTPLDPFNWQYLVARKRGGDLYHRPVTPNDPGPQYDLEMYHGQRVWFGRHNGDLQVAPAVEYDIAPSWNEVTQADGKTRTRQCDTAVCAAFYDTGVAFGSETAKPGSKVRVKYRYTGYPASEAESLFKSSKVYSSATLDPNHHYIFADEWPKLTFSQFVPLSQTWIYGRSPFMTGHNQRPTYELEKNCGAGSGFAMKLGPASFGKATLLKAGPLGKGRYVVTALVKSVNTFGPGGRMELEAVQAKTNKVLASAKHFFGNGSFDWQKQGFAFDLSEDAGALSLALGNSGTGELLVTDVEFRKLPEGESLPSGVLAKANDQPAPTPPAPSGAIADYRMEEGQGLFVLNYAQGALGHLCLANIDWVNDSGRRAIRFAEISAGRKDFRLDSALGQYLGHPSYAGKETLPIALTGHHGGGSVLKGITLAAWIKPDAEMGKSHHGGKGDVIGYGGRRFILGLHGQKAPYKLAARVNVNDVFESPTAIEADRWTHIAMTASPDGEQWRVRTFLNGQPMNEGLAKLSTSQPIPPSLILGVEIFYFHDAYYRGLIGRTLVFERALTPPEITDLAKQ